MEFVFIEDRDVETGHGWRDYPHQLMLDPHFDGPDSDIIAKILGDDGWSSRTNYASYSYAWISPKAYYDKHHCLQDNIRTSDVRNVIPKFKGVSDMESHFEFRMNPKDMRDHLIGIGMTQYFRR
jgi:hypothetical protein